jgi:hypothetical protein
MTLAPTPAKNPTDALVAQVIRIDGSTAITTEDNRVLKYQIPRT